MNRFLVNLAIIKVNWDRSQSDLLDNYMPLLSYAISSLSTDIVSAVEIRKKIAAVADITLPYSAVITLLKRAESKRYGFVVREGKLVKRNPTKLVSGDYLKVRDLMETEFEALKVNFGSFYNDQFARSLSESDIDAAFFSLLYELAPHIFERLHTGNDAALPREYSQTEQGKYLVAKYVNHLLATKDSERLETLTNYVHGALLTETFYFIDTSTLQNRLRGLNVYFDTKILLQMLGYTDAGLSEPSTELNVMLQECHVTMRCFRHTFDELHKIFFSVHANLSKGSHHGRPGDVLEYCRSQQMTQSDLLMVLDNLEEKLKKIGVEVVDTPAHQENFSVDERVLESYIRDNCNYTSEDAMRHDISSVTAVYRLRSGRTERYLEACGSIFVTSNTPLARGAYSFFIKEEDDINQRNAPLCIGDHVFTTFVWLKSVKKTPNLPRQRLVSASLAAINPSGDLWANFAAEIQKLRNDETLSENDKYTLLHSIEARRRLMDHAVGLDEPITEGTVEEILMRVKDDLVREKDAQIAAQNQSHQATQNALAHEIGELKLQAEQIKVAGAQDLALVQSTTALVLDDFEKRANEKTVELARLQSEISQREDTLRQRLESAIATGLWSLIGLA